MVSSEEAKKIAKRYLEKNKYSKFSINKVVDKIFKWEVSLSSPSRACKLEILKEGGTVINFEIGEKTK